MLFGNHQCVHRRLRIDIAKCQHIIGGGNSKDQPELATFMVKRADGSRGYLPLDALISGNWDADTMSVAHEGFSLRLTITPEDDSNAVISVQAESTYSRSDSVFLNLPLRLLPAPDPVMAAPARRG